MGGRGAVGGRAGAGGCSAHDWILKSPALAARVWIGSEDGMVAGRATERLDVRV